MWAGRVGLAVCCANLVVAVGHLHGLRGQGAQGVDQVVQRHVVQVPAGHRHTNTPLELSVPAGGSVCWCSTQISL